MEGQIELIVLNRPHADITRESITHTRTYLILNIGMQRKLCVGMALIGGSNMVFLDEVRACIYLRKCVPMHPCQRIFVDDVFFFAPARIRCVSVSLIPPSTA